MSHCNDAIYFLITIDLVYRVLEDFNGVKEFSPRIWA